MVQALFGIIHLAVPLYAPHSSSSVASVLLTPSTLSRHCDGCTVDGTGAVVVASISVVVGSSVVVSETIHDQMTIQIHKPFIVLPRDEDKPIPVAL